METPIMNHGGEEITVLLHRLHNGDRNAEMELMPAVYDNLHRMAEFRFRSERQGHTLQATALISELYLRVIRDTTIDWKSRDHFYRVAAQTIRRILVDHARAANAGRRPQPTKRAQFEDIILYSQDRAEDVLMIDDALTRLKEWNERQATVVELRCFAGLTVEETAATLGVAERTVKRDWMLARAWLSNMINNGANDDARKPGDDG
ncbi:MAG TPA: ECF-type sigma factor [Candidatus Acidoferrum sp.]|nr:ECF-type sigma factor [Candidatus Acidoferrum sp.]